MKSNISNLLKFTLTNLARSFLKSMSSFQSMFLILASAILDLKSAWASQCTLVYGTHRPPTFLHFFFLGYGTHRPHSFFILFYFIFFGYGTHRPHSYIFKIYFLFFCVCVKKSKFIKTKLKYIYKK